MLLLFSYCLNYCFEFVPCNKGMHQLAIAIVFLKFVSCSQVCPFQDVTFVLVMS